jgi:circadian clock protein KaiC
MTETAQFLQRASTGIAGLDDVLCGGWARNRLHLLEGSPGTGKTTIALQFLMAGAEQGEAGIYVSLAEIEQELRDGARSHGWTIGDHIEVFEVMPPLEQFHGALRGVPTYVGQNALLRGDA